MRRGDRLFQLLLELGRGRVRTAKQLGERLGVSGAHGLSRDVADLAAQGTPVEGAAGIGYSLRAGYQVPPLMFERDELEALALGAAWVSAYADGSARRRSGVEQDRCGVAAAPAARAQGCGHGSLGFQP